MFRLGQGSGMPTTIDKIMPSFQYLARRVAVLRWVSTGLKLWLKVDVAALSSEYVSRGM